MKHEKGDFKVSGKGNIKRERNPWLRVIVGLSASTIAGVLLYVYG